MIRLEKYFEKYGSFFYSYLDDFVKTTLIGKDDQLLEIFRYHLELSDDSPGQSKRIRPMLLLICAEGSGADWMTAVPAAVAVELIHNFSLIHDDIEDKGHKRRGKEAVWVKWGLPLALNAGDAMYTIAYGALSNLVGLVNEKIFISALELFISTCLKLTEGQHLDISFEKMDIISKDDYYRMISGKTAALFACCTQLGALIGGKQEESIKFKNFGESLGITFQIHDDWLGVWGEPEVTGKSTSSDLVEGKKSLPVMLGLIESNNFSKRWKEGKIKKSEAKDLAKLLKEDGVELLVWQEYDKWKNKMLNELDELDCADPEKSALYELIEHLTNRKK